MPTDLSPDGTPADATGTEPPDTTPRYVLIVEDDEELAELLRIWSRDRCGSDARIDVAHSIAGSPSSAVDALLEAGEIEPVGELLPSGDGYAWLQADGTDPIESEDGAIAIYGFTCETSERYVTDDGGGVDCVELAAALESAFK